MRCPDCNKFVSFDTEVEPEEENEPEIDGSTFRASYRRVLQCGECGTDLKSATIELEVDVEITGAPNDKEPEGCKRPDDADPDDETPEHEWSFDLDVQPTERTQTKDRHGKAIKLSRYMRRFYGVSVTGAASCMKCDAEAKIEVEDDQQASGFDEEV
jgi:hypothetical protein